MKKDKYITVALDDELHAWIIAKANAEDRTPSAVVRRLIKAYKEGENKK